MLSILFVTGLGKCVNLTGLTLYFINVAFWFVVIFCFTNTNKLNVCLISDKFFYKSKCLKKYQQILRKRLFQQDSYSNIIKNLFFCSQITLPLFQNLIWSQVDEQHKKYCREMPENVGVARWESTKTIHYVDKQKYHGAAINHEITKSMTLFFVAINFWLLLKKQAKNFPRTQQNPKGREPTLKYWRGEFRWSSNLGRKISLGFKSALRSNAPQACCYAVSCNVQVLDVVCTTRPRLCSVSRNRIFRLLETVPDCHKQAKHAFKSTSRKCYNVRNREIRPFVKKMAVKFDDPIHLGYELDKAKGIAWSFFPGFQICQGRIFVFE